MENQYNYYVPDSDNHDEEKTTYEYDYEYDYRPNKKKRGKTPLWVKILIAAILFGTISCLVFQAGNLVSEKIFGVQNENQTQIEETPIKESTEQKNSGNQSVMVTDVSGVAENVMPSIVAITNLSVKQVQDFFWGVREQESESAGSGIIIQQTDDELLILTNNHVVEGCDTLTVSFTDQKSVNADIKGVDPGKDLAVIAVQLSDIEESTKKAISVAKMGDSSLLKVGEPAIAIGNALGYGQSVTAGIISATHRTLEGYDGELIQTDAAINPGNSGGALLNSNGEVIGINTIKLATEAVEGMGYAIPISDASEIISELSSQKTKKKVSEDQQGYLGIQGVDVNEDSAQMYGMPTGVYVSEVIAGGACEKAGIVKGSVITKLEGTTIDGMQTLKEQLQYYAAGEKVKLTLETADETGEYVEKTVEVKLGKK